jgi:Polyketide cyclase / dehydrase and lipid transport
MQTLDHDEVRLTMAAAPAAVHALVADVTRMPELSPEIVECHWLGAATGPAVGARFAARNKFSRGPSAVNKPVITALEPDRLISWSRTEPFGGTVEWTYEFLPHAHGTEVVESYRVTKPVSRIGWWIIGAMASRDRRGQLRAGMEQTLQRIREVVESNAFTEPSPRPAGP